MRDFACIACGARMGSATPAATEGDTMADTLTLYTHPQSRGRIAHWMLEETGQPYEVQWLEIGSTMKDPAYCAINPMGKVPAIRHAEVVVTEAAAICTYLADRFPASGLAPAFDDPARGPYLRWLFFAAGPLEQATTATALGWLVPPGRQTMVGFGSLMDTLDALEQALQPGPWILGQRFSAADVYVGSAIRWGLMFGTVPRRPAFEAYAARLGERPALQRADAVNAQRLATAAAAKAP